MGKNLHLAKYLSGFSLIEVLVVLSIMGVLFGTGYANYRDFSRRQVLYNAQKMIQADLRLAQSTALSGRLPTDAVCNGANDLIGYAFNMLSQTRYEIRASCTGGLANPIKDVTLPAGISITNLFPLTNPIIFKILGSGTNISSANVTLTLSQTGGDNATITVSKEGQIQ